MFPFAPRSRWTVGCVVVLAVLASSPRPAASQVPGYAYRAGEVVIRFKPGISASDAAAVLQSMGASRVSTLGQIGASCQRITSMNVEQAVALYRGDPRVQYIEPNYELHADATPNDPLLPNLWGMLNNGQTGGNPGADIRATQAWSIFTGSSSVLVGIIDTGMDYTHPDLAANVWTNPGEIPGNGIDDDGNGYIDDVHGWDFVNNDNNPMDDHGHGTHVAGTIGAVGDNSLGVVGVSWQVKMMPIKFLDAGGSGTLDAAIAAIEYATKMHVRVMNNSWGGGPYSQALHDAIAAAGSAGIVFVASAGNSSSNNDVNPAYPASYDLPNIISVAASDEFDNLAYFSNYGATTVDIAAPGTNILSTWPGSTYQYLAGTSMAAPHVTGAMALIMGAFPGINGLSARSLLLSHADRLASMTGFVATGGRLNAFLPLTVSDTIPPSPIADLSASSTTGTSAELAWSATGDDHATGRASHYDLRYSTTPITAGNFDAAASVVGVADPLPAGSVEHAHVGGLAFSTAYFFAIKAFDELGNSSGVSNVATATTLGPPVVLLSPTSFSADLLTGASITQTLTVSNSGVSGLEFSLALRAHVTPPVAAPAMITLPLALSAAPILAHGAGGAPYAATELPKRGLVVSAPGVKPARVTSGGMRILIANAGGNVTEIRDLLAAFPDVAQVDTLELFSGVPTLSRLSQYHVVIVSNSYALPDPNGFGNVLADYVDAGGGVVLTLASFINGLQVGGRFLSGGYHPFALGVGPAGSSTLGAFDTFHPIMLGVGVASGELLGQVTVAPGAHLVASWANGFPFVATQGSQVAAVNLFFGGPGYWSGDVPLLMHNAALWVARSGQFLSVTPNQGVVPPGGSTNVDVTFDAARLYGGIYDADIAVATNDPSTPLALLPAQLHVTGAPNLSLSVSALEFGQVFTGAAKPETVIVRNTGTDELDISSIEISPFDYTVPTAAFALAPGQIQSLIVSFAPASATVIPGAITIHSNDPDAPIVSVTLHGEGLLPPVIAVTPASLSADLLTGATADRTLTVSNSGGSPLEVRLRGEQRIVSVIDRGPVGLGPARPASAIRGAAGRSSAMQGPTLNSTAPSHGPVALGGTYSGTYLRFGLTDFGELLPFQYPVGNEHLEWGAYISGYSVSYQVSGVAYFFNATFMSQQGIVPVSYREVTNTLDLLIVEVVTQTADARLEIKRTFTFVKSDKGVTVATQLRDLSGGGLQQLVYKEFADWDVDGVFPDRWDYDRTRNMAWAASTHYVAIAGQEAPTLMDVDGWNDYQSIATVVDQPVGPILDFDGLEVLHYDLGALATSASRTVVTAYAAGDDLAELQSVVDRTARSVAWLSMNPTSLVIPPGASRDVTVHFDAGGLYGGDYDASVVLDSNDPIHPETLTPAHLHVTGAPDISVSASALDFGQQFLGGARPETLTISNLGTDRLNVSSIGISPPDYSAPAAAFSLAPGRTAEIVVTFTPASAAVIPGTLEIHSDDPDAPLVSVALRGEGLVPPVIAASPSGLSFALDAGTTGSATLTLENHGGSALNFAMGSAPAASANRGPFTTGATGFARLLEGPALASLASSSRPIRLAASSLRTTVPVSDAAAFSKPDLTPLSPAIHRTRVEGGARVLVIGDGGTEVDVTAVLGAAGYVSSVAPDRGIWDGTNPPLVGFSVVVLLDGINYGFDMPESGQRALLEFVASGGGLIVSEWIGFEVENGRYQTLRPAIPFQRSAGSIGPATYLVKGTHPVTAGVDSPFEVTSAFSTGYLSFGTAVVTQLDGSPAVVAAEYSGGHVVQFAHAGNFDGLRPFMAPAMQRLLVNSADWVSRGGWLSADPRAGSIAPGGSVAVTVTADATTLIGGAYDRNLVITSNDPQRPALTIPVHLLVTGIPHIAVTPPVLDFGTGLVGYPDTLTVHVRNSGTELLHVTGMSIAGSEFALLDNPTFDLAIGASRDVRVRCQRTAPTTENSALVITSNDPVAASVSIELHDVSEIPPVIGATPASFSLDLVSGASADRTLTFSNSGGSPLDVRLRAVAALTPLPVPSLAASTGAPMAAWHASGKPVSRASASSSSSSPIPTPTLNSASGPHWPVVLAGTYSGVYLRFGLTDFGEIMPFQQPLGYEHLDIGSPISGYTIAYDFAGGSFLGYCAVNIRALILPVSYREIINTPAKAVVEVVTQTADGRLQITRQFTFQKAEKGVQVATTLHDMSGGGLQHVVYKEYADWDMDGSTINDWDYDRSRNMAYASNLHFAGIAAAETPALMDLDGWGDLQNGSTYVDYPTGPVYHIDGLELLHFDLGNLAPSSSRSVLTVYAGGDNLADLQNAVDRTLFSPSWLTLNPVSFVIPPGASRDITLHFESSGLPAGNYDADVEADSDDPVNPALRTSTHLHVIGVPDIALSTTAFDFGQLFAGGSRTDTLVVSNLGTDALSVTSIDVSSTVFQAPSTPFSVAIGGSARLPVTYAPSVPGVTNATLTVHSNDPDEATLTVTLHGEALEPPRVAIYPPYFQELIPPDVISSDVLNLMNSGGSPLTWSVYAALPASGAVLEHQNALAPTDSIITIRDTSILPPAAAETPLSRLPAPGRPAAAMNARALAPAGRAAPTSSSTGILEVPALADVLTRLNGAYGFVTSVIPHRFDFFEGEFGDSIIDGGENMYDGGNLLQTDIAVGIPYSNNLITNAPGFGGPYFTRKYPGLFVLAADAQTANTFNTFGDLGADGLGHADGSLLFANALGVSYIGWVKRVYGAGSASVNHLIIMPFVGSVGHTFPGNTNSDFDKVTGILAGHRLYYLLFAGDAGAYIDDASMLTIMEAFLASVSPGPPWLSVLPTSGVVPIRGSSPLTVRFDTHGMVPGSFDARIVVNSDDPATPQVFVPVNLVVAGPTATDVSLVASSTGPGVARLTWYASQAAGIQASIERRTAGSSWVAVGSVLPDGEGYLRFEDRSVAAGMRYGYRLAITEAGAVSYAGESWLDVPLGAIFALGGLRPNPAQRELMVEFSLPDGSPASLELLDLAGRRLLSREVGSQGAGRHVLSLGPVGSLHAGVYLVRLQRGEQTLVSKGAIVR